MRRLRFTAIENSARVLGGSSITSLADFPVHRDAAVYGPVARTGVDCATPIVAKAPVRFSFRRCNRKPYCIAVPLHGCFGSCLAIHIRSFLISSTSAHWLAIPVYARHMSDAGKLAGEVHSSTDNRNNLVRGMLQAEGAYYVKSQRHVTRDHYPKGNRLRFWRW